MDAGQKGNWDRTANGDIPPNAVLRVNNGVTSFDYHVDANGRVNKVEGTLAELSMTRNGYAQICAGGDCRQAGDVGGHLIAASLGGAGDRINIVPQASVLNTGAYLTMENELRAAVKAGQNVMVKIEVGYPAGSVRPSSFNIVAVVNGVTRPYRFTQ